MRLLKRIKRRIRRRRHLHLVARPFPRRRNRRSKHSWKQRVFAWLLLPLWWVTRLWTVPWRLVVYANHVLTDALKHRHRRHFIQGLPAFVVGVITAALGVMVHLQADDLVDDYRDAALRSYRSNDFEPARLYFERLIELEGETPNAMHDLAITLSQLGSDERAEAIMTALAPIDGDGYARAHMWLATRLLHPSAEQGNRSEEQLDAAYAHLMQAKRRMRNAAEIDWMLAQYFAAKGRREAAIPHLLQAAQQKPELYFELSLLYASLGRVEEARRTAYRADGHYRGQVQSNPQDHDARLRWASIRVNVDDFDAAIRILSEGLALRPDGPYQQALAATFITRYDRRPSQETKNPAFALELLRIALKHDPNSTEALQRLIALSDKASDTAASPELLETLLASGYANAFVHFVLGCRAWQADEADAAVWHLQRAYRLDPQLAPVANNLAWVLSQGPESDQDRALQIIDSVVERAPNEAAYRDTRGQIYVKLERWREALDDLEVALPKLPQNRELHEALAKVYGALGRDSLATKHTQIAKRLLEQK